MIREQYRVEGEARTRFVKRASGQEFYKWCEQSDEDPRYDVSQGTCEADDLPDHIREKCDSYEGMHYACEWPL